MINASKYITVKDTSEGIYKEKGSKFIGIVVPCDNEEEAKEYIGEWRKLHHQARHFCYAYRFGIEKNNYRANDDGEPNNSAGIPILGQIKAFDLTNVLICVIRYYGGTKLGVGGLIHAYKTAAKEAISNGELIEREVFQWVEIKFNYEDMPGVMSLIKKYELEMKDHTFEIDCILTTRIPLDLTDLVTTELTKFESIELNYLGVY